MIIKRLPVFAALAVIALSMSTAYANAADVAKGKQVFNRCRACHSLQAGKNMIGPSLHGLFGRTAGTAPDYSYSDAMKKAGKDGLVWNESTLFKYLKNPQALVPGDKMPFAGLRKKSDRRNVIAFLKQATK